MQRGTKKITKIIFGNTTTRSQATADQSFAISTDTQSHKQIHCSVNFYSLRVAPQRLRIWFYLKNNFYKSFTTFPSARMMEATLIIILCIYYYTYILLCLNFVIPLTFSYPLCLPLSIIPRARAIVYCI